MKTLESLKDVSQYMEEMYETYHTEHGTYPFYADCLVRYNDDGTTIETTIKLDCAADDEEDDSIFFYCNGLGDLKGLTRQGPGTDFTVVKIFGFH